ncbi:MULTISPECIES: MBL fold metallo-hydrolase [unclassified Caulobacter]|uniref:MBL fold metallo-hydrolase n=1 Tax=unclassified Caulobacter TaxID=2648921 RepID=UPI000D3B26F4|nr:MULTISPECIES: MBL fold metallo-hydrolase [unclassified Caulobacter]PTS88672.1 MBL fold metallo-hydrolase [Caulobacter sp. HMWF009]PTT05195.1 MBL fold metallo-hydrolase [Caulobacter sp. HMWF025]
MKTGTRIILAVVSVAVLLGAGAWLVRGRLATTAIEKLYVKAMARAPDDGLADGLHVGLCGAGGPLPDPKRMGPCTAVLAGKRLFVIDSGSGAARNLAMMNLAPARIDGVFLTHYHSDHIDGLGEVLLQRWAGSGNPVPVPVYGPEGVQAVLGGFMQAYTLDKGYRVAHHGAATIPPSGFGGTAMPFTAGQDQPDLVLINEPDLKVTAFPVHHDPVSPAVGYAFTYKGRTVVISGDTAPSARVEAAAKGADLLVHEALSPELTALQQRAAQTAGRPRLVKIFGDIPGYHTSPEQAAELAQRAGVRYLLLSHIVPALPVAALEGPFLGRSRTLFKGGLRVGRDGDFISLPSGSDKIIRSDRLKMIR